MAGEWWEGLSDWFSGQEGGSALSPTEYSVSNPTDYAGALNPADYATNPQLQAGNFPIMSGLDFTPNAPQQSVWERLGNFMGMNPDTQRMVGQLAPLGVGAATAIGAPLIGSALGSSAGKAVERQTQRITRPTAQEQNIMNMGEASLASTAPGTRSVGAVTGDMRALLAPFIENMLQQEGQGIRRQTEGLVGSNMAYGGVLPQQRAYLMADTNRSIAQMISKAITDEMARRSQEAVNMQNVVGGQAQRQQQGRMEVQQQGVGQANQAAQAAGRIPVDSAALGAMIAQILSGQGKAPGYRG